MNTEINTNLFFNSYRLRSFVGLRLLIGMTAILAATVAGPGSAQSLRAISVSNHLESLGPADDQAVLDEVNAARADPRAYAQALRDDLSHFKGAVLEAPGRSPLMTVEGPSAVEEAIADLERRAPAPPLRPDSAIAQAALRLVADEGPTGRLGHVASDGATLRQRLEAAGVRAMAMEEDIAYGPTEPREVVRELIVDDGVPDRGHRAAIFDPAMSRAGSACGPHTTWRWVCVIDFAGGNARSPGSRSSGR
jgi:uncharacterized protein YkwD